MTATTLSVKMKSSPRPPSRPNVRTFRSGWIQGTTKRSPRSSRQRLGPPSRPVAWCQVRPIPSASAESTTHTSTRRGGMRRVTKWSWPTAISRTAGSIASRGGGRGSTTEHRPERQALEVSCQLFSTAAQRAKAMKLQLVEAFSPKPPHFSSPPHQTELGFLPAKQRSHSSPNVQYPIPASPLTASHLGYHTPEHVSSTMPTSWKSVSQSGWRSCHAARASSVSTASSAVRQRSLRRSLTRGGLR